MIPYGQHTLTEEDIAAVVEVLHSDRITQGDVVPRFETAIAEYCSAKYALAVSSGTAALHMACLALDVGPDDLVWTTPNTFVASANCARYCGADVDFVDIDPRTYNMSVESLRKKLVYAREHGRLPKAVIPVHFAGQPCDMRELAKLSAEFGFFIIEDACHALGSEYEGKKTGSCRYSDIAVFSFHPVKMITTGEGGMLLTNNPEIHKKVKRMRTHGIDKVKGGEESWMYQQRVLGFNYRLTDIQAALGYSQLKRLDASVAKREGLATRYDKQLQTLPLVTPYRASGRVSSWHLYVVQLADKSPIGRKELYQKMHRDGVGVNVHYIPVHTQPYYRELGFHDGQFPRAEAYYSKCLTLPLYPSLHESEQDHVISCLSNYLR